MLKILLLLISVRNLYGLACYSNMSLDFSRNEFNWNNFSSILSIVENQITSTISLCHVRITVDYYSDNNNYVNIKLGSPLKHHHHTHIEFGSTVNFYQSQIQSVVSYLDYTCLSRNFCEKIFLKTWPKLLLNALDNPLHTSLISLWKSPSSPSNVCNPNQVTEQCSSHLCFIVYDQLKNLSFGKSQCKDKPSTNPVHIYVKIRGGNSADYQCIKNHCTEQALFSTVSENTARRKTIFDTVEAHKLYKTIFIRAVVIVGVLLIIGCIVCYFQCRKYTEGYRLTATA